MGSEVQFPMYTNDDKQFDISKKIPTLQFRIEYPDKPVDFNKPPLKLQEHIIANPLNFPLYNKISFKPNNVDLQRNELNIWSGKLKR